MIGQFTICPTDRLEGALSPRALATGNQLCRSRKKVQVIPLRCANGQKLGCSRTSAAPLGERLRLDGYYPFPLHQSMRNAVTPITGYRTGQVLAGTWTVSGDCGDVSEL